jgi:hypothetical protein
MQHKDGVIRMPRLLLTLAAALVIICSAGRAGATEVQGGPGGGAFTLPCAPSFPF